MDRHGPDGLRALWTRKVATALLATLPVLVLGVFIHAMSPSPDDYRASRDGSGVSAPQFTPRLREPFSRPEPVIRPDILEVRRTEPIALPPAAIPTFRQTVYIRTPMADGTSFAYGSGFIIRDGIIVTAAHVLKTDVAPPRVGCLTAEGEREVEAEVLANDHDRDIAVLRAPPCRGIERTIRAEPPGPNEPLRTSGFHFGMDDGHAVAAQEQMTSSLVPGVTLEPDHVDEGARSDETVRALVQAWRDHGITPAYGIAGALIPGKSGSAVFAFDGEIVGMVIITAPLHNRSYVVPPGNILDVLHSVGL